MTWFQPISVSPPPLVPCIITVVIRNQKRPVTEDLRRKKQTKHTKGLRRVLSLGHK